MKTPKIILHSPKVSAGKTVAKRLHMSLLLFLLISACRTQTIDVLTKNPDVPSLSSLSEVTNESTGASLFVRVYEPAGNAEALPVLILVPGGNGDSQDFVKKQKSAQTLADEGFTVITFDPDGRGLSEGVEDYDGFKHQDGLKAIIEAVEEAGAEEIGLVTFSFGITMGSGVLARYPELPVDFLIDWEGPANRDDTGGCKGDVRGHLDEVAQCDDETFWSEREASTFMSEVQVPYLRIQSEEDHVQPDAEHAWILVTAALKGESPWVTVNNGEPNTNYASWEKLPFVSEKMEKLIMVWIADKAKNLLEL